MDFTGTVHTYLDWMTDIQFWPAILALNAGVIGMLVVLTLIFGRLYCSVICPLGITQDIISWFSSKRKGKKARFSYKKGLKWVRYSIAVLFVLVFALVSASWASLVEPYSAFGRIAATILAPLYGLMNNALDALFAHFEIYLFYPAEVLVPSIAVLSVAVLTLAAVGACAWVGGRTYCNTVCPVGTVLGVISQWSLLKPVVDTEKCNGCGICEKKCKGRCIDSKQYKIDYSRCVVCMDCIENCKQGAISYKRRSCSPCGDGKDKGRRGFLSVLSMLSLIGVAKAEEKLKVKDLAEAAVTPLAEREIHRGRKTIVPAGAQGVVHLQNHCIACMKCVAACPQKILTATMSLGKDFMQPHIDYTLGYCDIDCDMCGQVCPTGAIRPVTLAEKSSIQIGQAIYNSKYCTVYTDHRSCGNCARHCPTGAIRMVKIDPTDPESLEFPSVNIHRCIGCGACEHVCPARPKTAIFVKGLEKHDII